MNEKSTPESGKRRPYQSPMLEDLGPMSELTAGGSGHHNPSDSTTYQSS